MKYMINGHRWAALIKSQLLLLAISSTWVINAQIESRSEWESELYAEHPLVGRIWDSASAEFIDVNKLTTAIERASYLLLGEKHDNPDHHSLQQEILSFLIKRNRVAGVAFEMMDSDAQSLLDEIESENFASLEELKNYLRWDEEGWNWSYYGPLVNLAYAARIPIAAANINNETMQQVYVESSVSEAIDVLDELTMQRLNIDIDESHCGLLPDSQFPAMVRVQQARDYAMANSLRRADKDTTSLLFAGNYHIRQDLGVPNYLLARDSSLTRGQIVALSFMEVDEEIDDPSEYLQQFGAVKAFDFIWFTPAISDEDYCASLR